MNQYNFDPEDSYIWQLRDEWLKSQRKYTDEELVKVFPEAKIIVRQLLKNRKRRYAILRKRIKKLLEMVKNSKVSEFKKWFVREWIKVDKVQDLLGIGRDIRRLNRLDRLFSGKTNPEIRNWQTAKELALQVPILEIAQRHVRNLKRSGQNYTGRCLFHDDRHPSMVIYPETNSYFCFGCQNGGSVINFTQGIHNCSYKEAVKILNKNYAK